jgi:hypothetical protein
MSLQHQDEILSTSQHRQMMAQQRRDISEPKPGGTALRPDSKATTYSKKEEASSLNPQMMKALKLFAKNHHELEKVSDPDKGNPRRVLSHDGRRQS